MAKVLTPPSCSLKEFRLLPGFTASNGSSPNVSLRTRLCRSGGDYLDLHIPFISAAMQAVTGTEMAIAIAQLGGIGILPVSQPMEEQCEAIDRVKRFKATWSRHWGDLGSPVYSQLTKRPPGLELEYTSTQQRKHTQTQTNKSLQE